MKENPGAYQEAQNRLREQKEREERLKEHIFENFEKQKEILRTTSRFSMRELQRRIETMQSVETLSKDIENALKSGEISKDIFEKMRVKVENHEKIQEKKDVNDFFDEENLPFSDTDLAKFFENQRIGERPIVDLMGFFYGFFVQGGAIFVILLWKIFCDIIFLPRDIYFELYK